MKMNIKIRNNKIINNQNKYQKSKIKNKIKYKLKNNK